MRACVRQSRTVSKNGENNVRELKKLAKMSSVEQWRPGVYTTRRFRSETKDCIVHKEGDINLDINLDINVESRGKME